MNRHTQRIAQLHSRGQLAELDLYFARFLLERASQPSEELALAAALACRAAAEGHVCLDLKSVANQIIQPDEVPNKEPIPPLDLWRESLRRSGVVGHPGDYQPLILDGADRLYLHRYWDYEQRLAKDLLSRAQQWSGALDRTRLAADIGRLFPPLDRTEVDWQKLAAATAVLRHLSVISGGPGTGKTTTVTKILALLRLQPGGQALRIALAAPTGKAASRMQEAIHQARSSLGLPTEIAASIPEQATTLHRLLGVRQGQTGFRHHRDNRLPVDVLILDEASMIDVALMVKLLDALPQASRLILLGDKDQLASVEAGAVLGDICGNCAGPTGEYSEELRSLTGEMPVVQEGCENSAVCDSIVVLRHSYRFGEDSEIGRLAAAVKDGDLDRAVALLGSKQGQAGVSLLSGENDTATYAAEKFLALTRLIAQGAPVESLFAALNRFRLLCALKQGPAGSIELNQRIISRLRQAGVAIEGEWFPGRPIMVSRNDYQLKLFNGDVGITLPDPQRAGEMGVVFQGEGGELRWLAPTRLPPHETVFAMTVHKSQGSEFEEVLLLLPDRDTPLLSRELIYTAITRARAHFILSAPVDVFQTAVKRRLSRQSGLADLLQVTPSIRP